MASPQSTEAGKNKSQGQTAKPGEVTPAGVKPANGTDAAKPGLETGKPGEAANGTDAAKPGLETGKPEEGEERTRGVIPHMPLCVIWRDPTAPAAKAVTAALIHPRGGEYMVSGRGTGGTRGQLEDEGYPIGPVRVEGPKWVEKRIPAGVEVLGYAPVLGFPLPSAG
jgi:hypothetical protein